MPITHNKQSLARLEGRTVFTKNVKIAPTTPTTGRGGVKLRVLKWGGSNVKIGGMMKKGRWAGMPIFSLTLEERKTCPTTCQRWNSCYGDNMFMAFRYQTGYHLESALRADLEALSAKHPKGYVVRLHVLGDFYSVRYVQGWTKALELHPALHIYGYTHWQKGTEIGDKVAAMVARHPAKVGILRSDNEHAGTDSLPSAMVIPANSAAKHSATNLICPNETGKVASCGECGLCMNGRTSVSFLDHSHQEIVKRSIASRGLPVLNQVL